MELRQNPFRDRGFWYWRDTGDLPHGPYPTQLKALRGLVDALDPTPWHRALNWLRKVFHACHS